MPEGRAELPGSPALDLQDTSPDPLSPSAKPCPDCWCASDLHIDIIRVTRFRGDLLSTIG